MFLDYYQMQEQPFGVTPDPRFLYLGNSHREALASLFYGIEADRGFMVLIAHPGFGKTTLIFQLLEKLKPDARTVFLFQTQCNSRELIQYLLNDLGVDVNGMETVAMHNKLNQILAQEREAGRRFVLIVDEAHNLDPSVLETIRLLSNFETSRSKLLQILLVGQPLLARKLASPALEQLQQRISMFAKLEPIGTDETARYIAHRLKVAGYTGGELFTSGAMEIIRDRSQGIPRNINRLCFSALSLGCAMGRKRIDAEMMREVVADLEVESLERESPLPQRMAPLPQLIAPRDSEAALAVSSPILSYHATPKSGLSKWGLGLAGVAASLVVAFGLLSYSHGKIGQFLSARASAAVGSSSASMKPTVARPAPVSPVTTHGDQGVNAPAAPLPAQPASEVAPAPSIAAHNTPSNADATNGDPKTVKVVVRPGETLQKIALRTLGQDDSDLIKEIQHLNPHMTDPDHIVADQEIRLPLLSKTNNPLPPVGANNLSGKN